MSVPNGDDVDFTDADLYVDDAPTAGAPTLGSVPAARVEVVNWITLPAEHAATEWERLDAFVEHLRHDYGLPPTIIPPLWHRHWELVWELSALHTLWQYAYGPGAAPSQPLVFHRYFSETRGRLREWVATSGTKLDTDRPTRHTTWPGEPPSPIGAEHQVADRRTDFETWVSEDVADRLRHHQTTRHPGRGSGSLATAGPEPPPS